MNVDRLTTPWWARRAALGAALFALLPDVRHLRVRSSDNRPTARWRSWRQSHRGRQEDGGQKHRKGQAIFRFDTFGDEQLWTNVLRMHEPIATVDPETALAVGLKVDVDALPRALIAALRAKQVDLTIPPSPPSCYGSTPSSASKAR